MISRKMLGLLITLFGMISVVSGTILYLVEPLEISKNTFCDSFCLEKPPIYCYRTIHGFLFDMGWLLTIAGSSLIFLYRKQKLVNS